MFIGLIFVSHLPYPSINQEISSMKFEALNILFNDISTVPKTMFGLQKVQNVCLWKSESCITHIIVKSLQSGD